LWYGFERRIDMSGSTKGAVTACIVLLLLAATVQSGLVIFYADEAVQLKLPITTALHSIGILSSAVMFVVAAFLSTVVRHEVK